MAAGISDKLWDVTDIVRLIEAYENEEEFKLQQSRKQLATHFEISAPDGPPV